MAASPPPRWVHSGPAVAARGALARLVLAGSLPKLRGNGATRAIRAALSSTALGRVPPEERAWIERIEERRRELAESDAEISRPVLRWAATARAPGREPDTPPHVTERVSRVSPWASVPPTWGVFLLRLVRELGPSTCLELGTGFGISGAYQVAALELNGDGRLVTIDGAAERARLAEAGFSRLGLRRVELRVGRLGGTLELELRRVGTVDYAYVDANHDERATLWYFESLLRHLAPEAVLVLDDIHWSKEMRRAWRAIAQHPRVGPALDLYRLGVCVVSGPTNDAPAQPE